MMAAWFVEVVASKMTEVDRMAMQGKETGLGDRSDWEDEKTDVSGDALVSGLGN